jgi:hypothetical protein
MLQVLRPTYTFRVTVRKDPTTPTDHGWNGLTGKSGCDEVWGEVMAALKAAGLDAEVFLEEFTHTH